MRTHRRAAVLTLAVALVLGRHPAVSAEDAAPTAPSVGDVIPAFDAQRIDGTTQKVSFPKGSTTVLLFFLSGCPHCHKMIPEWNRAYERRPASLTVLGVIMDQEPLGFFDAMPVSFPVVRSPGREFMKHLKVNRVPLTLRVGPGGAVQEVEQSIVDPIRLGELFRR